MKIKVIMRLLKLQSLELKLTDPRQHRCLVVAVIPECIERLIGVFPLWTFSCSCPFVALVCADEEY